MIARKRRRIYAFSIAGLLLALWLRPATESTATVMPTRSTVPTALPSRETPRPDPAGASVLAARAGQMPGDLFASPPLIAAAAPMLDVSVSPIASAPDLQMLGWVLSGQVHWVSVMCNNTSYTLQPGEQVDEHYRYEGVREEMAVFTSLRDGTSREYPISDVTISDQD